MTDHSDDRNILDEIQAVKKRLKTWLLIFTHHYQLSVIVDIGDFRGTLKDGPQTKVFDALE